ncbi:hypothetical protein IEZ26_10235 [Nocardioides cavernae]|uniref:WD40 repeat domain-containing protein n=1 Tax=Nocardioides cavernae TaxID=1921566 RepID=A0ABR8NA31_9ACTN|nr:hypothetical protein [Nocardioides cavernae]MBD3924998.1 hypothetical protein [Nocardioides cavernae]MBM7514628.1 hypothetical protein [Nocardioides cavernae]
MSPTPLEDQVHDALHRTADPLQRAPFTVTDVRTRARRIQRRRAVVAGAAVAAVLAIAIPVGAGVVGPSPRSDVPPATEPPAPRITGTVRIDPLTAPVGAELAMPLINVDDESLTVDGETVDLPRLYDQLTPYVEGWIGIAFTDDVGGRAVQVLDPDFRVLDEVAPASPLAVSPDGSRIAWAWYDGSRWTVVDRDRDGAREERWTALPPGPQDARVRPVGFLPGDALLLGTTDPATNRESASVVGPDGSTTPLPGSLRVGSVSEATGLYSVQTSFTGDGSCWQVRDAGAGGAEAWQTCDYSLLGFSPDGRHLLGFTDYLTPDGSPTMAVLDAATGERVVDFELVGARTSVVGINPEVAWEDDDTVAATLVAGNRQYVVRLALDGTVERVGGEAVDLQPGQVALKLAAPVDPPG